MNVLGINIGHDTSSALIKNGKVVAACEQERYNKKKLRINIILNI